MPRLRPLAAALIALACLSAPALAQDISFGGLKQDPSLPVEITADSLSVDQASGEAIFSGNVLIGQGEMRMSAGEVRVIYGTSQSEIERLVATGGVTLATPTDAAEAQTADYTIASGAVVMDGNVLVTQGANTISAEHLVLNLIAGTGRMDGRVRTIFTPAANR